MEPDKIAPAMSDDAVMARTGKTWSEWFAILDAAGAAKMTHPQIASYLSTQQGVPDWWSQMVAVTYEKARGLREQHQQPDGYQISKGKTYQVPAMRVFTAWNDPVERSDWLPTLDITVTTATPGKSIRASVSDGTRLDVNIYAKGAERAQIALQHQKISDAETAETWKAFWSDALEGLKKKLEG
jgi:uncharacterized phage protein gp47/JayE